MDTSNVGYIQPRFHSVNLITTYLTSTNRICDRLNGVLSGSDGGPFHKLQAQNRSVLFTTLQVLSVLAPLQSCSRDVGEAYLYWTGIQIGPPPYLSPLLKQYTQLTPSGFFPSHITNDRVSNGGNCERS